MNDNPILYIAFIADVNILSLVSTDGGGGSDKHPFAQCD
jgi:hypothetical protein